MVLLGDPSAPEIIRGNNPSWFICQDSVAPDAVRPNSIKRQNQTWLLNLKRDSPYQLTAQLFPFGPRPWQQRAPCTVPQPATVSSTGLLQTTFAPPRGWEAFRGTCGGETISIGGATLA